MKNKLYDFLKGRNGADQFTKFVMYLSLAFLAFGSIFKIKTLTIISLALILYANFRVFSRNLDKRIRENQIYLQKTNNIRRKIIRFRNFTFGKDGYKYLTCDNCKADLRVPKHKGKIKLKCPKCENIMNIRT